MQVKIYVEPSEYDPKAADPMADLTIADASGTSQQQGVDLPLVNAKTGEPGLTRTYTTGSPVAFSAQWTAGLAITLTCRIVGSDGTVIATNTSTGPYTVVTCSGIAR